MSKKIKSYKMTVECKNCKSGWDIEFPYGTTTHDAIFNRKAEINEICKYCGCVGIEIKNKPKRKNNMKLEQLIQKCLSIGEEISRGSDAEFGLYLVRSGSKIFWIAKIGYLINREAKGSTPNKAVENLISNINKDIK